MTKTEQVETAQGIYTLGSRKGSGERCLQLQPPSYQVKLKTYPNGDRKGACTQVALSLSSDLGSRNLSLGNQSPELKRVFTSISINNHTTIQASNQNTQVTSTLYTSTPTTAAIGTN